MTRKPDDALSRALDILQRYPVTTHKLADKPATYRMEWQPIETAKIPPEEAYLDESEWVLFYDPGKGIRTARADLFEGKVRWWTGESYDSDELHPTHWMPLPDPPTA